MTLFIKEYLQNFRDVNIKSTLSGDSLKVPKICQHVESCQISLLGSQKANKSAKIFKFGK